MDLTHAAILVMLGILPSLLWMLFFLRRDGHPEPKYLLTKTFLMGIIVSPMAIVLQIVFVKLGHLTGTTWFNAGTLQFLVWAAFVEEFVKFYAVRLIVLNSPEFDEPVDAMIYMMVAGLGFAAIENILVLFRTIDGGAGAALTIWGLRSGGATLLHALACSLVGYFLALAWFFRQHHKKLLVVGLIFATAFHVAFNFILSSAENGLHGLLSATSLLLIMALLVSILFVKIRSRRPMSLAITRPELKEIIEFK